MGTDKSPRRELLPGLVLGGLILLAAAGALVGPWTWRYWQLARRTVRLEVAADGTIRLEGRRVLLTDLAERLRDLAVRFLEPGDPVNSRLRVFVRADPKTPWKPVRDVTFACLRAGIREVHYNDLQVHLPWQGSGPVYSLVVASRVELHREGGRTRLSLDGGRNAVEFPSVPCRDARELERALSDRIEANPGAHFFAVIDAEEDVPLDEVSGAIDAVQRAMGEEIDGICLPVPPLELAGPDWYYE